MDPATMEAGNPMLQEPDESEIKAIDDWWRAANYLAVGMICLQANPLLREP